MKVCIVTIYNASNYGAHLQALALKTVLEEKGHQVVHLDTGARNPKILALKKILKRILTFDWRYQSIKCQWNKGNLFTTEANIFHVCKKNELNDIDLFIFGSDEIWNIKRKQIYKYPLLFGKGILSQYKASYAISINDALENDFLENDLLLKEIKTFKKITVRDIHSMQVLQNLIKNKEISMVLDPTFLLDKEYYMNMSIMPEVNDYILLYSYGNHLDKKNIIKIKEYAYKHKLKLVSVLGYLPWCDYNFSYSTEKVLGLFLNASVIFTDTFHGTIFSIIFEKEFVIISEGTKKLLYLLDQFDLQSQQINSNKINIEDVLMNPIDYDLCREKIETYKVESLRELDNILKLREK